MSECVVRMEMPSNCERCPMCGTASGGNGLYKLWCMCGDIPASSQRRPEDCPIICSLPEGHGRLVDSDEIMQAIDEDIELDSRGLDDMYLTGSVRERLRMDVGYKNGFKEYMRKRPTVVPAERSET